jgi:hypothetical protein
MSSYSFRVTTGGQTIDYGGLVVSDGGATVTNDGMTIASTTANKDVLKVTSSSTGFTQSALNLIATR